jgi:hypothetical protein
MKTHKVLLLALIVIGAVSVSAQPGKNNGNGRGSQVAPARGNSSGPTSGSASGLQYGGGRMIAPSQHFSSIGTRSMPTASYPQRYFNSGRGVSAGQYQGTRGAFSGGNGPARFESSRGFRTIQSDRFAQTQSDRSNRLAELQIQRSDRAAQLQNRRARDLGTSRNIRDSRVGSVSSDNRVLSSAGTTNHVFARRSADWQRSWDRSCDHWWQGHRCRFINGSWFIFDFGFIPWYGYPYYYPYDYYASDYYYPYGYDPGVYEGYDDNYYGEGNYDSSDQYDGSTVAAAQERLARLGYYRGRIDGVFGPETRRALTRYQSDNGLRVTGYLTSDTVQSLGLRRGARY